jgi:hypothetical protein
VTRLLQAERVFQGLHLLCNRVYFVLQSFGGKMRDLDKALADIFAIRSQIAAGTAFRGYGPATVAATGGLALLTALLQFLVGRSDGSSTGVFLWLGCGRAVVWGDDLD